MFEGKFVKLGLIIKGVYPSDLPILYPLKTRMEDLISNAKAHNNVSKKYIEHLKMCELVTVTLEIG